MILIKSLIIAHRGASYSRPENTLAAFELALEQGADGIETDLRLSKDQIPVLIHDATLNRTTNGQGAVAELSSQALKTYDNGSWYDSTYHQERILTLAEFLEWGKSTQLLLNLELKPQSPDELAIADIVYQEVVKHRMLNHVVFSSFNSNSLRHIKSMNPKSSVFILSARHTAALFNKSKQYDFNGVLLKYRQINQMIVNKYHQKHKSVGVYTVNQSEQMRRCFRLKCDMIITDRPGLAVEKKQVYLDSVFR